MVRNRGIHSSGILCSTDWQLVTKVLGQTIGPNFKSHIAWPLNMEQIGCTETSVTTHLSKLCNIPEGQRSHQHCGRSLKSRKVKTANIKRRRWYSNEMSMEHRSYMERWWNGAYGSHTRLDIINVSK